MVAFDKVIGIGLPRCAGQTLMAVLEQLLGEPCHHSPHDLHEIDAYRACVEVFHDPQHIRHRFPDSLLILNTRQLQPWLRSCKRVYGLSKVWNNPLWSYPVSSFASYRNWYLNERWYLSQCLAWDITLNPSWDFICDVLHVPPPNMAFPYIDLVASRPCR